VKLFSQGRYATITSTLALVVALGGTSYAAVAITGADIKNGTVTTADIKNHNLTLKDFAASTKAGLTGAAGAAGAAGAPGAKGDAGIQGVPGIQGLIGPSDAYSDRDTGSTDLTTGTDAKVISLQLDAGSYVVLATASVAHTAGTASTVTCSLSYNGGPSDDSSATSDAAASTTTLNSQLTATFAGATEVDYYCHQDGGANAIARPRMDAIKVGAVH
jgi:hypothetical protein